MSKIAGSITLLTVLVIMYAGVCPAQETDSRAKVSDPLQSEAYAIAPVTVTAIKTEEDVQKIPVSTTALSGTQLEDAKIEDTNELTRMVPNMYLKKSTSENVIIMRGITSYESSIYSPTAVFVDDLMVPLHFSHLIDLYDIERVEVLRGPQGSLYGGNSLAGVINIITRRPDNEKRLKLYGDMGSYTGVDDNPLEYNVGLNASGPLVSDRLYLGLAGNWKKGDGFTTNLYDDDDRAGKVDRKNARAVLRWTPAPAFDITLTADILDNDDGIAVYRFDDGPYRTDPYTVSHDDKDYQKESGNSQNLRVAYTGETLKFLSVTGFRDYGNENVQDYDATADPMNHWGGHYSEYDNHFISQEFRLSSTDEHSPFKWLAGVYGFTEDTDVKVVNDTIYQNADTTIDAKGYAAFGEGTCTLFERLHLTAGLRYDVRRTDGKKQDTGVDISDDMKHSEVLPKFSVGYDLTDRAYGYVTISKGFLAGGYNYGTAVDKDSFAFDPEYTWNYELGIKTGWLNNRLQVNLAVFYIDMTDKQVMEMDYGQGYYTAKVDNAAEAHSKGVELEIRATPATGWDVFAGIGYTDAEYDDWIATEWNSDYTGLTRNDYSGKTIPNVPEYTGNLGVQYRHGSGLFARADVYAVGPLYADQNNRIREDAYALVNLQLGYEAEHFDVVLWGKNVFNTHYHTVAYDWDGLKLVQDGRPAMFGVRTTLRF